MRSMTGYGRGSAQIDGRQMTVELKSVNHRFPGRRLPHAPQPFVFEEEARRVLGERLARGHVDVYISYQNLREGRAHRAGGSGDAIGGTRRALEEIARLSGARLDVTALELSQLADVVSVAGGRGGPRGP